MLADRQADRQTEQTDVYCERRDIKGDRENRRVNLYECTMFVQRVGVHVRITIELATYSSLHASAIYRLPYYTQDRYCDMFSKIGSLVFIEFLRH